MSNEPRDPKFPTPQDDADAEKLAEKLNAELNADLFKKHPQLKKILIDGTDDDVSTDVRAIVNYLREAQINLSNFQNFHRTRYDNSPDEILKGDLSLVGSRISDLKRKLQSDPADRKKALEEFIADYESQFENLRARVKEYIE